ncbi:acetyl-CoA carboxylase biotin carboxylase subunit family protein [Marinobacter sp.]|uniref:ATP-grasp domain-containing protein n=1 Tax=Marinobacter sp. TaxID=50741 RepID=UPI003561DDAC
MNRNDHIKNIFVVGFDERHGADLLQIPDACSFNFLPLLRSEEIVYQQKYDIEEMLDKARGILRNFDGSIDGMVCHWDFPATSITAILCQEFNLPCPSLEAILKCSHKYWSRTEQRQAAPENTPDFCAFDPFDDDALSKVTLDYPFWIKPVKGYGSLLGFRINDAGDFHRAIGIVRERIHRLGDPFNTILAKAQLPEAIAGINGNYLIAEELLHGLEIAPEGSIQHGQYRVHGMIDMVRDHNHKSFLRYEYPSKAPKQIQQRAIDVAGRVLQHIGFDNGCFNMEFFWDKDSDKLQIIEINPRISQSHSYQFEKVDGISNHEIAVHVAVGDEAHFVEGKGPYKHAAKFLLRHYTQNDAVATRVPTKKDLSRLLNEQPDTDVILKLKKGERLSSLIDQDAYSYVLAEVHVAAQTTHEMLENYHRAVELLPFEFEPVDEEASA